LAAAYQFWYTMVDLRRFPAYFYRSASGESPVLDWLRALPRDERATIGIDLQRLEYRWPIGLPHSRPLGRGLHELRSPLPGGRTARLLFFVAHRRLIIVVGFIKKTRRTPQGEIELARARMRTWENAGEVREAEAT